ncbi:hypothetical protein PUNSTDRAFT_132187 [Punctularia strigosozonata HHB-11173 SS5]|uniref:uncharacterized protein n=1 Tax=Punctularia strigosozonata (strain HHB-11173) TaxID=741275 RepID=UPI0004416523|nr:uncharacterized protein PUNSTDRAFT_132187 [Punctularia strigosozonata HHB-11173 SS5]EIN12057.1 hypothetical protein PUNSTDRAFT_132187 [Punctularia strigosozonata HHB-11173 SS5]
MSGVWSLFGILGVLRACLMLVVGIAGAEAAGVKLSGAGAFTARKTSGSRSTVVVGVPSASGRSRLGPDSWWQDDKQRLLGLVDERNSNSSGRRPHIVVIGFTKCPFTGPRALRESADIAFCVIVSVICTIAPLMVLRPTHQTSTLWIAMVPVLLQIYNDAGAAPLSHLHASDRFSDGLDSAVIRDSDTANTEPIVNDCDTLANSSRSTMATAAAKTGTSPLAERILPKEAVHFGVASGRSKLLNVGATNVRLKLTALDKLSEIAPADIIAAPYCDVREAVEHMRAPPSLSVIRLPWSFVETYVAQGLILGSNSWALGGLYLAAIVSVSRFWGLTMVHLLARIQMALMAKTPSSRLPAPAPKSLDRLRDTGRKE